MGLGLRRTDVRLSEYDSEWERIFRAERARLAEVLGERASAIEHIGSTSIPGLKAKPILDIAVGLWTMEDAAVLAGTIQYELLCHVSPRVPRVYLD